MRQAFSPSPSDGGPGSQRSCPGAWAPYCPSLSKRTNPGVATICCSVLSAPSHMMWVEQGTSDYVHTTHLPPPVAERTHLSADCLEPVRNRPTSSSREFLREAKPSAQSCKPLQLGLHCSGLVWQTPTSPVLTGQTVAGHTDQMGPLRQQIQEG